MIVFSALVIVFARFFRTGLWGLTTQRRPRVITAPPAGDAQP
jgi:hypothetical protein